MTDHENQRLSDGCIKDTGGFALRIRTRAMYLYLRGYDLDTAIRTARSHFGF